MSIITRHFLSSPVTGAAMCTCMRHMAVLGAKRTVNRYCIHSLAVQGSEVSTSCPVKRGSPYSRSDLATHGCSVRGRRALSHRDSGTAGQRPACPSAIELSQGPALVTYRGSVEPNAAAAGQAVCVPAMRSFPSHVGSFHFRRRCALRCVTWRRSTSLPAAKRLLAFPFLEMICMTPALP